MLKFGGGLSLAEALLNHRTKLAKAHYFMQGSQNMHLQHQDGCRYTDGGAKRRWTISVEILDNWQTALVAQNEAITITQV